MANEEQVAQLKRSISEWNLWRTGNRVQSPDLRGADLSGADLSRANLDGVRLRDANFTGSIFDHTLFVEVDLSTVQGLEAAEHHGPSTVNINSAILPYDEPTRTHFLRGVGFTETQIHYLPSLLTPRPIQYPSLFISYAHEDEAIAQRLHTDLQKKNVPCWYMARKASWNSHLEPKNWKNLFSHRKETFASKTRSLLSLL